jgi:hypothetical protein
MNDLVERLRTAARKACTRHNGIDQFDLTWQRKPKDFIEWDAADRIEQLEAALRKSCQCGEGMCSITGEQCVACAALEGGDEE